MPRRATDNKQKLLDAALNLIWRASYGAVSVDDICTEAGVKKGSFYYYFKSKADLAVAVIDAYWLAEKPLVEQIYDKNVSPLHRLHNLADHIINKHKANREKYGLVVGCPFSALGSEMAGQEEAIRTKCDEIASYYAAYLLDTLEDAAVEGYFHENSDLQAKTEKIYAFILGQVTMARIQNSTTGLERDLLDGIVKILNIQADPIRQEAQAL